MFNFTLSNRRGPHPTRCASTFALLEFVTPSGLPSRTLTISVFMDCFNLWPHFRFILLAVEQKSNAWCEQIYYLAFHSFKIHDFTWLYQSTFIWERSGYKINGGTQPFLWGLSIIQIDDIRSASTVFQSTDWSGTTGTFAIHLGVRSFIRSAKKSMFFFHRFRTLILNLCP